MSTINTLADLREQKRVLEARKVYLETEIKRDFEEIKEDLEPLRLLTRGAKNLLSSHDNSLLGNTAGYLADFVARNLLFKKAGFITKLIVPFLIKNTTANLIEDNKSKVINGITNLLSKFIKKSPPEEQQLIDSRN